MLVAPTIPEHGAAINARRTRTPCALQQHLARFDAGRRELLRENVLCNLAGKAGRMRGKEDEARTFGKHALHERQRFLQVALDLVRLAARAASERGRVEDHGVVAALPTELAAEKLVHVVHDPADRTVLQPVQRGVVARPLHHAFRGVEVAHLRAALRRRKRTPAGIGKQVQHLRAGSMRADPVPLRALLGEDAEVAEVGAGELEADAGRLDRPLRGQRAPPVPAVAFLAVERG